MRRLRVLRGHAAHARFNALLSDGPVAEVPRDPAIPSPYSYSADWPVFEVVEPNVEGFAVGTRVVIRETRHARYEVFEVQS